MSDSAWLQRAINAGGTVELPAGDLYLDTTLNITGAIEIVGHGPQDTVLHWAGGSAGNPDMILIDLVASGHISLRNFGINGETQAYNTLAIRGSNGASMRRNSVFEDLHITGASNAGIILAPPGKITESNWHRIEFNGTSQNSDYCLYKSITSSDTDNAQAAVFSHCAFRRADIHGVYWYNDSSTQRRTAFVDCTFESNYRCGIYNRNCMIEVLRPHFENNGRDTGAVYADIWLGGDGAKPNPRLLLSGGFFSNNQGSGQEYDAAPLYERIRLDSADSEIYVRDCKPGQTEDRLRYNASATVEQSGYAWTTATI